VVTVHGLVVESVERAETGEYHVAFGCLCGAYSRGETAATEADALAMAANRVRIHEAEETGAGVVDIRFD
jgi:hypothetical protein